MTRRRRRRGPPVRLRCDAVLSSGEGCGATVATVQREIDDGSTVWVVRFNALEILGFDEALGPGDDDGLIGVADHPYFAEDPDYLELVDLGIRRQPEVMTRVSSHRWRDEARLDDPGFDPMWPEPAICRNRHVHDLFLEWIIDAVYDWESDPLRRPIVVCAGPGRHHSAAHKR